MQPNADGEYEVVHAVRLPRRSCRYGPSGSGRGVSEDARLLILDGILGHAGYSPLDRAIARKREGLDLDYCRLAWLDKADVLIEDERFHFNRAVQRHDDQQRLPRADDLA